MEKKFKCKDEVLYRRNYEEDEWTYGIFSHYHDKFRGAVVNGEYITLDSWDILPYEGNEHLVDTADEPYEEVKLEKGEWVMAKTDNGNWVLSQYKNHCELPWNNIDVKFSNQAIVSVDYIVKFSDFNPNDMEETRKHILAVKNGKIVRYKG